MIKKLSKFFVILFLCAQLSAPSMAQETEPATQPAPPAADLENASDMEQSEPVVRLSVQDDTNVSAIPSLFFTPEALALIRDAIQGLNTSNIAGTDGPPKDPGIRELSLGGIVYHNQDDWTVWLNGRRITPDTIPEEILDLNVNQEYADIKWYDAYTNRLFPVRLRPNERFNIDSRLFLTGTHSPDQQLE